MPSGATDGARDSLREPRVPHDAAALVAAAARARGARSDAEAARVGTAEILALLRAPRDGRTRRVHASRARCGWALDHGVVDALVEAMRAHADCVPVQTLAATCLADVAEAFVGVPRRPRSAPLRTAEPVLGAKKRGAFGLERLDFVFPAVPRRVPFDARRAAR